LQILEINKVIYICK